MAKSRRKLPSAEQPILESWLVFKGRIRETGAAAMPGVPVTDRTAVVVVDKVLHAPPTLGDQAGRTITIELAPKTEAKRGLKAVFYTEGWLYGEGLAVREVRRSAVTGAERLAADISNTLQKNDERVLAERVTTADLVIAGRVSNIRQVTQVISDESSGRRRRPVSEHDPDWWEAVIAVQDVLRGKLAAPVAIVLFPMSIDVMWFQRPKFQAGQEGVWLLRWLAVPELDRTALTALEPIDYQPKEARDAIGRLAG